jgi:hypothetical protein
MFLRNVAELLPNYDSTRTAGNRTRAVKPVAIPTELSRLLLDIYGKIILKWIVRE